MPIAIPCQVDATAAATAASATPSPLCSRCEAVCCRLTVVLMPDDDVPEELVLRADDAPDTMRRGEDGWCLAVDRDTMRCGIYADRPQVCRDFAMGGDYCLSERENWQQRLADDARDPPRG